MQSNIPRAAIHVGKDKKSFSAQVGNEAERRGWDENVYRLKNADKEKNNHYNFSRKRHNFEIVKGGKIVPLGSNPIPLHVRVQMRLDELDFKPYMDAKHPDQVSKNSPNCTVGMIFSGDHDVSTTTIQTLCYLPRNGGHCRKRIEPTIQSRRHPRLLWSVYHTPRYGASQEKQNRSTYPNFILIITMRLAVSMVLRVAYLTSNYPKRKSEDESTRTRLCLKPSVRQRLHLTRWRNMLCLPLLTDVSLPFHFLISRLLSKRL